MRSALGLVLLSCGLFLLTGTALPLRWGLMAPALVVGGLFVADLWRNPRSAPGRPEPSWDERIAGLNDARRLVLIGLTWFSSVLIAAAAAVGASGLLVAFPAAVWVVLALAVAGVVLEFVSHAKARIGMALALAALAPMMGMVGARFEASGEHARGWAHSGQVHGIHPFQTTSVVVDGHGPFDIAINDYVTPEGTRGYSARTLAPYLERALHRLAELRFPDGPARAWQALAGAEVEAVRTGPIAETRSGTPPPKELDRFIVRSGTYGWRSSVEFVCPGQRIDPRPREADLVMIRMCPTKYAAEASAGIGVTGRWPGYAEARGQSRATLANLLGWTRSGDREGRDVLRREQWLWTGALLIGVVFVALRWVRVGQAWIEVGGGTIAWAAVGLVATAPWWMGPSPVAWLEQPAAWGARTPAAWLPAIVVAAGLGRWWPDQGREARTSEGWARLRFLFPVLGTLGLAMCLPAQDWVIPSLAFDGRELPLEAFVVGAASHAARAGGFDPQLTEACLAAGMVVGLVGLLAGVADVMRRLVATVWQRRGSDPRSGGPSWWWVSTAVVIPALLVVWSDAIARALPATLAVAVVLGSALRGLSGDPARLTWRLVHGGWVAVAVVLLFEPFLHIPPPETPLLLVTLAGLFLAIASTLFLREGPPPKTGST